jgi:electron transfer flavoprotein alpha subunit
MVLVYSDEAKLICELLSKARELAEEKKEKCTAVCIGNCGDPKEFISYGADEVIVVKTPHEKFKAEEYTDILTTIIKENGSQIILIGSNKNGKELAPRLAARCETGCITDCINVYLKNDSIFAERMVYSGNGIAVEQFTSTPEIVTIPPKQFEPLSEDANRKGDIITKKVDVEPTRSSIVSVKELKSESVNVEEAEIIVSCGRGFKSKDDIKLVSELAEVLKGKTVGCSRPIAADLKWLSEDHWIGLSGHKVKPKLYIAAGISGQIQHIAGMRDSGIIVAINKDPEALIFKSADYGIVGDLYQIIPKLTDAIKSKMG